MPDVRNAVIVAGNYRCGTTWLAEMLVRGLPGYALLFEPIRAYYRTMADAGITQWRPYITPADATEAQTAAFQSVFDGSMVKRDDVARTDRKAVLAADGLVVKFTRGLMSLRWMVDVFEPRHAFVIARHPVSAIASQMRLGAHARGTPMCMCQLDPFFTHHPEVAYFEPQTPVEWLAAYWAASYHAALSAPTPHPWTLVKYEELCVSWRAAVPLFQKMGVPVEQAVLQHAHARPSVTTLPSAERVTHGPLAGPVWGVVERFPKAAELYDAP